MKSIFDVVLAKTQYGNAVSHPFQKKQFLFQLDSFTLHFVYV